MKPLPRFIIALCLPTLICLSHADEKSESDRIDHEFEEFLKPEKPLPDPLGVALIFEWIELDHRAANQLIRKHATQLSADPLREILERMLDDGTAELIETVFLVTKPGQRAKVESIEEHIYPTEWDPPQIPAKIHRDIPLDQVPIAPANPTAFDVRNIGTTTEVEPLLSPDGKRVTLNLAPEIVENLGDRTIGDPKVLHAALAHVYQPEFHVMSVATNLTLQDGRHSLVSLFAAAGKPDKRVMLLARANVLYDDSTGDDDISTEEK
ncbi:MAG: hypothetical protein ACI8XO_002756 [Verrucomicrobiales bacterium]|jgi:hypothetical protein